jgi:hypothetical protein
VPFLVVRLAYALLTTFSAEDKWNPLTGDIAPFVVMHSLMEYCVVIVCLFIGFRTESFSTKKLQTTVTYGP